MKRKFILFLFSLFLTLSLGSVARASACTESDDSVCDSVGQSDFVFVGKILSAEEKYKHKRPDGSEVSTTDGNAVFKVQEGFFGVKKDARLSIYTGRQCSFFEVDKTYLVYAHGRNSIYRDDKRISINDCVRALLISYATDELDDLRESVRAASGMKIRGTVFLQTGLGNSVEQPYSKPLANASVKIFSIDGKNRSYETLTSIKGEYEVANVPIGKYKVAPVLSSSLKIYTTPTYDEYNVTVDKNIGCKSISIWVNNNGELSGELLDVEGKPVKNLPIDIIALGDNLQPLLQSEAKCSPSDNCSLGRSNNFELDISEEERRFRKIISDNRNSDENGKFSFKNLPVGKYALAVRFKTPGRVDALFPKTFYPNAKEISQAFVFSIGLGEKVSGITFRLPPKKEFKTVKGKFIIGEEVPTKTVWVSLENVETGGTLDAVETDADGNFTLRGFAGEKYQIKATTYVTAKTPEAEKNVFYAESAEFVLDEDTKFFILTLKKYERDDDDDETEPQA